MVECTRRNCQGLVLGEIEKRLFKYFMRIFSPFPYIIRKTDTDPSFGSLRKKTLHQKIKGINICRNKYNLSYVYILVDGFYLMDCQKFSAKQYQVFLTQY